MSNTVEVIVKATDSATGTLRAITREVDALAARVTSAAAQIQSVNFAALASPPPVTGSPPARTPTAFASRLADPGGAADSVGDTFITVQVTMPDAALRQPAQSQSLGETFGDAIARRLRERG